MARLPERLDLDLDELRQIVSQDTMTASDREKLMAALRDAGIFDAGFGKQEHLAGSYAKAVIRASTEKMSQVCGQNESQLPDDSPATDEQTEAPDASTQHGETPGLEKDKLSAKVTAASVPMPTQVPSAYRCITPTLCPGDDCPLCHAGKLYKLNVPSKLVRLRGQAPIIGKIWSSIVCVAIPAARCSPHRLPMR